MQLFQIWPAVDASKLTPLFSWCAAHCFEHFLTFWHNKMTFYIYLLLSLESIKEIMGFFFFQIDWLFLRFLLFLKLWTCLFYILCLNFNIWSISIDSCICSLYLLALTHSIVFSYLFSDFWLRNAHFH